jgi:sulfhydrogenase subunit alpha
MKMKEVMNELTGLIGGRALHPVTHVPGGFTAIPSNEALVSVLKKLKKIRPLAERVVEDVWPFDVPDFHCDSEYAALDGDGEYAVNKGRIVSTKGLDIEVEDYCQTFEEAQVGYAFAKKSTIRRRSSFMVGALARLNNKFDKLQDRTKTLAKQIGFKIPSNNPFHNNLAQSLEVVDGVEQCIQLMESVHLEDEDFRIYVKAGAGGSVTEAPRGLLFHWYKINGKGIVEKANVVTPTSHNFQNIEKDLKKLVEENNGEAPDRIRLLCEQLVRAYDPCFSCSVH